jgi:hypothetical protein
MRNPETQTAPPASGPVSRPNGAGRERSPADATSILLELTRALRGLSAPTGSATRPRALAERAFQAVAADIARQVPSS